MTKEKSSTPPAQTWPELIMHANHVKKVLIDNGLTEAVRFSLAPVFDRVDRGARTAGAKKQLQNSVAYLQEQYEHIFFPEDNEPTVGNPLPKKGSPENEPPLEDDIQDEPAD